MPIAFRVSDLQCRYVTQGPPVLDCVSFVIPAGVKCGLLGRCGTGKSTLLAVLGLLWEGAWAGGEVYYGSASMGKELCYNDIRVSRLSARVRLEEFGFLFQTPTIFEHLTCEENVALPLLLRGMRRKRWADRVRALLQQAEHQPGELTGLITKDGLFSGGQLRRIALCRAIVHDPIVLFADEPFSNLDSASVDAVMTILASWHKGEYGATLDDRPRTLIIASHDLPEVWRLCDCFIVLNSGKVINNRLFSKSELCFEELERLIHDRQDQ